MNRDLRCHRRQPGCRGLWGHGFRLMVSDTTTPCRLDADGPLAQRLRGGAWEVLEKTFRSLWLLLRCGRKACDEHLRRAYRIVFGDCHARCILERARISVKSLACVGSCAARCRQPTRRRNVVLPRGKTVAAPWLRLRLASRQDSLAHGLEWALPPSSNESTFG